MPYTITEDCIGCTACAKACPVLAIDGAPKQKHSVNIRRCVSCGVCGRVCPNQAVLDGHEQPCAAVPRAKWKTPVVDTALCSACAVCISWCRAGALRISEPASRGDIRVFAELYRPSKCVGCGLCQRHCPIDAIAMREVKKP